MLWSALMAGYLTVLVRCESIVASVSFTYQGRIAAAGQPASGEFDLEFTLFDDAESGAALGVSSHTNVMVSDGLFSVVLQLPVSSDAFGEGPRYLEIGLRPSNSAEGFQRLAPRQLLTSVPSAGYAFASAESAWSQVAAEIVPGGVTSASIHDHSVTATKLAGGTVVRSINGLTDTITLRAGENITLTTVPDGLEIAAPSQVPQPTLAGGTLWVDETHGNDATALRERADRPWFTLARALRAVQNNDRLVIRPGNYPVLRRGMPVNGGDYEGEHARAPMVLKGRANVTIEGRGAVIPAHGLGSVLSIVNCTNITIRGLHFLGSGANQEIPDQIAGEIVLWGTNINLTFDQCRFENFPNHGIVVSQRERSSYNTLVKDCFFQSGGTLRHATLGLDGAAVASLGPGLKVIGCTFTDVLRCVEIEGTQSTRAVGPVIIANNVMRDFWSAGVVIFPVTGEHSHFNDIMISDNIIHGDSQIRPGAVNQAGIWAGGGSRLIIKGNNVGRCANTGIALTTAMASLHDVVIANNVCWDNGDRNITFKDTHDRGAVNAIISGNLSLRNGSFASIEVSGENISVTDNTIVDSAGRAIYVGYPPLGATRDVVVSQNRIRRTQWHPIGVGSQAYETIIHDNAFSGDHLGLDDSGVDTFKDQAFIGPQVNLLQRGEGAGALP